MATEKRYDGGITLSDLTGALQSDEQLEFLKLVDVRKQQNGTDNIATYIDDDSGQPPPLLLVEVIPPKSAASVMAEQIAQGKHFIFHANIFVESDSAEVLGFR
jgi:hypothetical protein